MRRWVLAMSVPLVIASGGWALAGSSRVKACLDRPGEHWSTLDQRECFRQLMHDASNELSTAYERRLAQARRSDAEHLERTGKAGTESERLEASQKAWAAYRDAECWGVIGGGTDAAWGSGTESTVKGCAAEKLLERIEELKVPFYMR